MNYPTPQRDSSAWIFQVWASFIISVGLTLGGTYFIPVDFWVKGYFIMGILFTIGSTFTLSKTIRDKHESDKIVNRVASAKTEKILTDYEFKDVMGINGK